jgi:hypothetical protein
MKRGTIVAFGPEPEWPPGFAYACDYLPAYTNVLWHDLAWAKSKPLEPIKCVRLYRGDLSAGGRGEIWHVPQPA